MDKVTVVIIDDNEHLTGQLITFIGQCEDLECVGHTRDGIEGIDIIREKSPDVVLLDLVLPMADGFEVLEMLTNNTMEKMPEIIVTSALRGDDNISRAVNLGARYYLVKPYDCNVLYKRIMGVLNGQSGVRFNQPVQMMPQGQPSRSIDERISNMFLIFGIPAHIKGYQFLREGIKLVVENPSVINRITKELYPGIAARHDTTSSKVERAIRHAIEVGWNRGKLEDINKIFGYDVYNENNKPTNGEFIATLANKIKIDMGTPREVRERA